MKFRTVILLAAALTAASCTPAERVPVRTALEASRCAHAVVLRHLDAGDDFRDPETLSAIAAELAVECVPFDFEKDPTP